MWGFSCCYIGHSNTFFVKITNVCLLLFKRYSSVTVGQTDRVAVELCEAARPGMYYHHTYFCRKAALLCSGLKGLGAGEITGT